MAFERSVIEGLLLRRGYAMVGKFAIGSVGDRGLFTHRFPANPVLAGFTNAAFQHWRGLGANHAFFNGFTHNWYFT